MPTYKIVRMYLAAEHDIEVIETGLTLHEAKQHCCDRETSSRTCTLPDLIKLTAERGPWFDGFEEER
jgi:hypothetical protein